MTWKDGVKRRAWKEKELEEMRKWKAEAGGSSGVGIFCCNLALWDQCKRAARLHLKDGVKG